MNYFLYPNNYLPKYHSYIGTEKNPVSQIVDRRVL